MISNLLTPHRQADNRSGKRINVADFDSRYAVPSRFLNPLLFATRAILIGSLGYATWKFGGVEIETLWHLAIALAVAIGLSLTALLVFGWRPQLPAASVIVIPSLFICYSLLQLAPLPTNLLPRTEHAATLWMDYGDQPAAEVDAAAKAMGDIATTPSVGKAASMVPQLTRVALIPIMLATVYCCLAAILFDSAKTRSVFLWSIVINATALACWGIVQRSTGTSDVLPGIPTPARSLPFASFIYRNAGAAAILPGIAAVITLLLATRSRTRFSESSISARGSRSRSSRQYGNQSPMFSIRELSLLSLGCVIAVGVVASLSRGAWIAGGLSLIVAVIVLRRELHLGKSLLVVPLVIIITSIAISQLMRQVEARMHDVSIEELVLNDRFSHWMVGWQTAKDYFPFGSGLGTYGYATLINQTSPSPVWFREAHNEFLETLTESGLVGLGLLIAAIAWSLHRCWALSQNQSHTAEAKFGLFGLLVLICAVVQNAVDFVASIPANLFLLATIFGIIGSVVVVSRSKAPATPSKWTSARTALKALGLLIVCASLVGYSISYSKAEQLGTDALALSSLAELSDAPEAEFLSERIALLDNAIENQPDRSALYRHRAVYRLAQYRSAIMDAGRQAGETIAWENTQPESIYAILASLPTASRQVTVDSLKSADSMKIPLSLALADISHGLRCNPFFGQLHLTCAALSPIANWAANDWIERSALLGKSDPHKMYMCGLMAYYNGQTDRMRQEWRDSLLVTSGFQTSIFELSLHKMSPRDIALQMVLPEQPDRLIVLAKTILTSNAIGVELSIDERKRVITEIAEAVNSDSRVVDDRRHAVAATIYELIREKNLATDHWASAVASDPKNPEYRYKVADGLRALQNYDEALSQVALGATLSPKDERFPELANRIRSELAIIPKK